jgi:DNA-binding transcriptional MerR regulator
MARSTTGTEKSELAFRTISEAAETIGVPQHVLRFWETRFVQLQPLKRGGNRRYYRPADMELLETIRGMLHDRGLTIRGAKLALAEELAAARDCARAESTDEAAPGMATVDFEPAAGIADSAMVDLTTLRQIRERLRFALAA